LQGLANICYEYATKRYRSNCINWGIIPFTIAEDTPFDYAKGDFVYVPDIREAIGQGREEIPAKVITGTEVRDIMLFVRNLTPDEKSIILEGCLMNFYASKNK
jgi:aconitate hydratase